MTLEVVSIYNCSMKAREFMLLCEGITLMSFLRLLIAQALKSNQSAYLMSRVTDF